MTNIHYGWLKEVIYCTKVFKIIYMFPFKSDQFSRNFKAWKLVNNKVAQPLRNGREGNSCIKRKKNWLTYRRAAHAMKQPDCSVRTCWKEDSRAASMHPSSCISSGQLCNFHWALGFPKILGFDMTRFLVDSRANFRSLQWQLQLANCLGHNQ